MVVLACEGPSEVYLIEWLIENDYFIFSRKEIVDRRAIHLRQPVKIKAIIETLPIEEDIIFYRIGDTQNDAFDISCFEDVREKHITVKKVCTLPELEMLIIINEGLFAAYTKMKSKYSPKEYVKTFVKDYISFTDYLAKHNLVNAILEYKRIKKNKNSLCLADFIKTNK